MIDTTKKRHCFRIVVPAFPAFNIYSSIARTTTALGPVCVASVVNGMGGWDVEVIDENNLRLYGPRHEDGGADHEFLQKLRPADVVGLYGGLTSTVPRLYQVARYYKEKGAVTIAGGHHFIEENIAEALHSGVDYLILGEAEEAIQELLTALKEKKDLNSIKGIAFLKNGQVVRTPERAPIMDFDRFPLPDFSLVRYAKIKLYPVGRIRGCGMDCEFCTVKGKPRSASPERLMESIRQLLETRDARHFFVVDDLFGQQREETIRFCRMLRDYQSTTRRRLDFTVQIRLDKAQDAELLTAMRQAGINAVAIGFESPIKEELEAMKKRVKPEDMIELARSFHKFGFLVHGMFIFGYPMKDGSGFAMSTKERIQRYRSFVRRARIDTLQLLLPIPLPGTELRRRLIRQNRVYSIRDVGWEYYDGNFPLFEPDKPLTAEEMQNSLRRIMSKFYRFRYLFMMGFHIISFPALVFFLHNIRLGWRQWYRPWRNSLLRFGGWFIVKGWTVEFKKGIFSQKLKDARNNLKKKAE